MSSKSSTESEYRIEEDGSVAVFHVTPSSTPFSKSQIACLLVLLLVGSLVLTEFLEIPFVLGILIAACLTYILFLYRDIRPKRHKAPTTFKIHEDTLECSGRSFKSNDIHRLLINNEMERREIVTTIIVGRPNLGTALVSITSSLGRNVKAKFSAVSNSLELEAGGKRHFIAGGMNEIAARGLLYDVAKRLGMQVNN